MSRHREILEDKSAHEPENTTAGEGLGEEGWKDGGGEGGGGMQQNGKVAGSAHLHYAPAALEVKQTAELIYCTD